MNYPKTIFLSLALLAMHSLNAEVVTYPAGAGVKRFFCGSASG